VATSALQAALAVCRNETLGPRRKWKIDGGHAPFVGTGIPRD